MILDYHNVETASSWLTSSIKCWLWMTPLGLVVGHVVMRLACKRPGRIQPVLWNASVKLLASAGLAAWLSSLSPFMEETDISLWNIAMSRFIQNALGFSLGLHVGESILPVALTGSIATGKSTTAKLLTTQQDQGSIYLVDLDQIAHDILLPSSNNSVYTQVVDAFEDHDILQDSGPSPRLIDRPKLGAIVFGDPTKRRVLNRITHRMIRMVMVKEILKQSFRHSIVCVDVPLLYEGGMALRILFGIEIVVACTPSLQFKRLCSRNPDLSQDQCRQRIESQISVDRKAEMANIVIWNNGTQKQLAERVRQVRREMFERTRGGKYRLRLSFMVIVIATTAQLYNFRFSRPA